MLNGGCDRDFFYSVSINYSMVMIMYISNISKELESYFTAIGEITIADFRYCRSIILEI